MFENSTTDIPDFLHEGKMSEMTYVAAAVALSLIGFFGFSLNLIVIIVIIKDSENRWTPMNTILFNLVVGDFQVAVFGNPLTMMSAINGGWYWSHEMCIWYAFLMSTLGLASIGNLTAMAVERWILVTQPIKALLTRHAVIIAWFVWVYAVSLSLPPVFGWGSYGLEAANVSCSVSWEIHDVSTKTDSYIAFLFVFGLIMPVLIIGTCYVGIIRTLRKVGRRAGRRGRQEAKVTKMVALMIIAFLLAWTPYAGLALSVQYFHVKPSPEVALLPAILAKSSICYNPIIYAGLNTSFLRSLKKLFGIRDAGGATRESQHTALTVMKRIEKKL
ncbi:parapinopsin [Cephus cinctus]|uniref:Parapinopsin n=1 Tax=Cephus cinctus TaxID=211228 RepID=A0AAJ7BU29_CEPCN|nr:parapinopsin [Cephus cinctus]